MAVNKLSNVGRRSAIALALAALTLPGIASAEPGGEDRGGWRGRGGGEAQGNISAGSWTPPAQQPQPQQTWAGRSDNGGAGWSRPQAVERAAPVAVPVPQAAPAPSASWSGDRGQRGGWGGGGQAGGTNPGGGWSGGQRGGGGGSGWNGGAAAPAPAPAPAPVPQQRWNGGNGGNSGGTGWNRPAPNQGGWNGNYTTSPNRDRDRDHDGDRNRGDSNGWNRGGNWSGNQGWSGNRDRDHDGDRYRGNNWNGSRYSYNRDYRSWDNRWRSNNRYDWSSYRRSHGDVFRLGGYYAPYRGYSYQRLSIGFFLDSLFFNQNYWINDPWQYRLPDVYGPYRWVRYYDDALLVNTYTGEVVDVIYSFFW